MNRLTITAFVCFFVIFIQFSFAETALTDSKKRLRLYDDDETQTVFSHGKQGLTSRLITDGDRYVQKNYDEQLRVVREIIFFVPGTKRAFPAASVSAEKTAPVSVEPEAAAEIPQLETDGETAAASTEGAGRSETPAASIETAVEKSETIAADKSETAAAKPEKQPPVYAHLTTPSVITDYEYEGNSPFASKVRQTDFTTGHRTETLYSPNNLPIRETVYAITDGETKEQQLKRTDWSYDGNGRLVQKKTAEDKKTNSVTYTWFEGAAKPDEARYENDRLVSEHRFESDGTKKEEILHFTGGVLIKNLYKDGKKNAEIVIDNGRVIREKQFD